LIEITASHKLPKLTLIFGGRVGRIGGNFKSEKTREYREYEEDVEFLGHPRFLYFSLDKFPILCYKKFTIQRGERVKSVDFN
jgi:hypothetical protein